MSLTSNNVVLAPVSTKLLQHSVVVYSCHHLQCPTQRSHGKAPEHQSVWLVNLPSFDTAGDSYESALASRFCPQLMTATTTVTMIMRPRVIKLIELQMKDKFLDSKVILTCGMNKV